MQANPGDGVQAILTIFPMSYGADPLMSGEGPFLCVRDQARWEQVTTRFKRGDDQQRSRLSRPNGARRK